MSKKKATRPVEHKPVEVQDDSPREPQPTRDPAEGSTRARPLIFETAWEVCRQEGGIYTVLRSKAPFMVSQWGSRYHLLGPFDAETSPLEFEQTRLSGRVGRAVKALRSRGIDAHYGRWLVTGQPSTVLLNPRSVWDRLPEIKYLLWDHHGIATPPDDPLIDGVVAFGYLVEQFLRELTSQDDLHAPVLLHAHEWMGGSAIPEIRRSGLPVRMVFTTHATMLGRFLAANDPWFYDHVPFVDWQADASRFHIEPQVRIERAAAHSAHLLTTVSEVTSYECEHLLGRKPDLVTPNGLNIERFVAMHEFQNLHREYKELIQKFVMAQFFPSYTFDLDKTLYFFSSGRYEYRNKGFDITLEALARLNLMLKREVVDRTVVFFLVTRRPARNINPHVLQRVAMLEELRRNIDSMRDQFGHRLFKATARGAVPDYNTLVDDYWKLRLQRLLHAWNTPNLPPVVTHDLQEDDEVLRQLRYLRLINLPSDPVKVVYHPDFITPASPLFGMDYDQFVRGCHMGIFPSFYEPWGYTPLESIALGLPAVTSDLSGFGTHVQASIPEHEEMGVFVTPRRSEPFERSAQRLAEWLLAFCKLSRRDRIRQRNHVESCSDRFDWRQLGRAYVEAYTRAVDVD